MGTRLAKADPAILGAVLLSVIISAFNEERYLPQSLSSLQRAVAECRCSVELIVVDNASTNKTAEIARASGARVVCEPVHNVARVRNTGAAAAHGEVLVFVDADTIVPHDFLDKVNEAITDPLCLGGSADIVHHVRSRNSARLPGRVAMDWFQIRYGSRSRPVLPGFCVPRSQRLRRFRNGEL
jgi:glycosyltransferase involved in cell wall biosynthesis